ncbi:rifamycin-inactivating phosphotransferase [Actinokineospora bangkokensis]|uniref:Rifampicin phosphotransferase n=1 Tax=Actinokineospora bangkokensis TaxID=1193682 RepID=A0A1Q9LH85_9PSEU|nr:rifamycin-inactivating phosphotransferase [Actinokineospora bangkokensis]OLR91386.1 phosphoenolpyruvate synthase [Actinokineospora bangkokensis]
MHSKQSDNQVLDLHEVDRTRVAVVGGKAAHLGELTRVEGTQVPAGFCVTVGAYQRVLAGVPSIGELVDDLARVDADDLAAIAEVSAQVRRAIEGAPIPDDLAAAITRALRALGDDVPCAVRSSATAEDLPGASFAGQQDTYLNVVGPEAVLRHVSRCWASLFTERAVAYRLRAGFDHRAAHMAVVVQRMVSPRASGVLFTADPLTSNRKVATVEAVLGLGEALVSGVAAADTYQVRDGAVISRAIAAKQRATVAAPGGGTAERRVDPAERERPALTDEQVVRLVALGRRVEAHFGQPQDIEWCLADEGFHVVQSRPITTLFPVPEAADGGDHVYVSVGHQQMMTDAMKPLGLSLWQLTTPRPMAEAGSRLFADATALLTSPTTRASFLDVVGKSDPLARDALETVLAGGALPTRPDDAPAQHIPGAAPATVETDPAIVTDLIAANEASVAALRAEIATRSGAGVVDFILEDMQELRRVLFEPLSLQVITAGMQASWWLNEQLGEWLGEKNPADVLTQSVPHNVTAEMGLALLDVADVVRGHPEVVAHLAATTDDDFLDRLPALPGGAESAAAIRAYLDKYGMRCVGEIDITRPRWGERPSTLLPVLLSNVRNAEPGAGALRFERGRQEALRKERDVLERLRALPDGERKAEETKRVIDRVRAFTGYREYPKYGMISRYHEYRKALLREADRLVAAGVLDDREDAYYLRLSELHEVLRTERVDRDLVRDRRDAFRRHEPLSPPRVITSAGETANGSYRRDGLPPGALAGLAVSAGVAEGRARVVLDTATAALEPGDILVTAHTDPSWSPLFLSATALVTEVGGLMTHGAVVAREYGLPAVVGVDRATHLIRDGQRIRVNATDGYVELLS